MSYDELELDKLGDEKSALFFLISDTDTTYNFLVALAFSQMFNLLWPVLQRRGVTALARTQPEQAAPAPANLPPVPPRVGIVPVALCLGRLVEIAVCVPDEFRIRGICVDLFNEGSQQFLHVSGRLGKYRNRKM